MSTRYLGELGERTLGMWASQVSIAANKADPDRTGWDFFLEFPDPGSREKITLPLDKLPRPIQCLVQVKTTDKRPGKRSVKLSNWARLVKSPLPAFFLVLEFDGKDDCQRAYLVHVDEAYISSVLKKLHALDSSMHTELNEITLQFKWDKVHELPSLNGKGLKKAVHSHVRDLGTYVDRKMEALRTVGYEDGKWGLDFVIPAPPDRADIQEVLVDFSLGLIPHLDVIQGTVRDYRFGVPAPEPKKSFKGGRIELVNREAAGSGIILLTSSDEKKELRLSTEVYLPQGIECEFDRKHFKARFAAPLVDFIFWPFQSGKADFRYKLPEATAKHSLAQLQPVSEFVLLLHDASIGNGKIGLEVRFDSKPLYTGYIEVQGASNQQVVDYVTTIIHAWTIAKHFDVHHDIEVTPIEILRQQERLMFVASVVGSTRPSTKVSYWSGEHVSDDGKSMCLPYVTDVVIGQYRMAIATAIIGQPQETGRTRQDNEFREFQFETRDVRLCRQYICGRDETPRYTFKDLAQSVVEEYEETTDILTAEGVNDHLIDS